MAAYKANVRTLPMLGFAYLTLHDSYSLFRVRNLNAMPEVREKIFDPDPNKAFTRAKLAKLNRANGINYSNAEVQNDFSTSFQNFPSDDSVFNKDFSVLPVFVPTDTIDHIQKCGKTTKKSAADDAVVEMSSSKGLRMVPFVHDMEVNKACEADVVYLRALCWASYRKGVKYKVRIIVNPRGSPKILSAGCDKICPAGRSGCCCHVMAVIWKLDEMSRNNKLQKLIQDDRACTSKPRKWGIPGRREVEHEPVMASKLVKPRHQSDTPSRKRRGVFPTLFDPRPSTSRNLSPEAVDKFRENVIATNPSIPFAKMTPDSNDIIIVDSIVGLIAKGSVLDLQLKDFSNRAIGSEQYAQEKSTSVLHPKTLTNSNVPSNSSSKTYATGKSFDTAKNANEISQGKYSIISPPKQQPVSLDEINERCKKIKCKLFVDESEIEKIEIDTRGQSDNPKWFEHRFGRVTASRCHRVACPHKSSTSPSKIIKEVLNYNPCVQTKAMWEGIKNEKLAVTEYVKKMQEDGHCDLKVEDCGFFVSKHHGFIGASPDGLVTDPSIENPLGVIEVKNITVKDSEDLSIALVRKSICKKDGMVNKRHMYYYQMQQQLYVVNRTWCDFVVRGSNGELYCKRVPYDPTWWIEKLANLESFYDSYILPELAYPRLKDGLARYDFPQAKQVRHV